MHFWTVLLSIFCDKCSFHWINIRDLKLNTERTFFFVVQSKKREETRQSFSILKLWKQQKTMGDIWYLVFNRRSIQWNNKKQEKWKWQPLMHRFYKIILLKYMIDFISTNFVRPLNILAQSLENSNHAFLLGTCQDCFIFELI